MFCALIKTKSAHAKLQSIKNAWSKDEIWRLEMAALPAQGNSESDKYRFNTAFLTGSDYYRYPIFPSVEIVTTCHGMNFPLF